MTRYIQLLQGLDQNEGYWSYEKVVQENRNWNFRQVTHFPWSCHILCGLLHLFNKDSRKVIILLSLFVLFLNSVITFTDSFTNICVVLNHGYYFELYFGQKSLKTPCKGGHSMNMYTVAFKHQITCPRLYELNSLNLRI